MVWKRKFVSYSMKGMPQLIGLVINMMEFWNMSTNCLVTCKNGFGWAKRALSYVECMADVFEC